MQKSGRTNRRKRSRDDASAKISKRNVDYRNLKNPFPPMDVFSKDEIASMHETALRTLEELGMKVLLPEAVELFRTAGARIKDDMVYICLLYTSDAADE